MRSIDIAGLLIGGPQSESGHLDGEVRTSSASQMSILCTEIFIAKSSAFSRTSEVGRILVRFIPSKVSKIL